MSPQAAELLAKLSEIRVRVRTKVLRAGRPVVLADIVCRTLGVMVADSQGLITLRATQGKDYDRIAEVVALIERDFTDELAALHALITGPVKPAWIGTLLANADLLNFLAD